MPPKLLVIDDDVRVCTQLKWALAQDFEVVVAEDRSSALAAFKQTQPSVVTLDLCLQPQARGVKEGFLTLHDILLEDQFAKVIVATRHEEHAHALEAIDRGAYDFFYKPIQLAELKVLLGHAQQVYELEKTYCTLRPQEHQKAFAGMLGACAQMQKVFATIRRVAASDAPVVICGESGTGKELVARAIHQLSERRGGPFIAINCGAIPEHLLESELFGYEKGAFTGAHIQRPGRVESAQGGTLFLDEVGDLPLALQVKLLRFLQEHQSERVGGRKPIDIDVRVLAATNIDLTQARRDGHFRDDLYYRLSVIEMVLPPLRERGADILLLAKAFFHRYCAESHCQIRGFSQGAFAALAAYAWPGNVRELENRIRRALLLAEGPVLSPDDLDLTASCATDAPQTLQAARAAMETELIRRALARNQGNITHTAAELSLSRPTLRDLMRKYGLRSKLQRANDDRSPDMFD